MNREVIIFGAGKNGEKVMQRLGKDRVAFFCDNYKSGTEFQGKRVISFSELGERNKDAAYDVILSVNVDAVKNQLKDSKISYWEIFGMEKNFFCQEDVVKAMDEELAGRFRGLSVYSGKQSRTENWFRQSFLSGENERLVAAMKCGDSETVSGILADCYEKKEGGGYYEDEYFINRPGMRLIARLIKQSMKGKIKVCDLACGHGEFLKEIKSENILCYGADVSEERCRVLNSLGIECRLGKLEVSNYEDEMFDYVTMMECLEHVENPFCVMKEAYRILKNGGRIFVTVPYGENCDFYTHVRQFYENDLYSVAAKCGYVNIKIMKMPYLNRSLNDNLFMTAEK